jgi:hypothetical protein
MPFTPYWRGVVGKILASRMKQPSSDLRVERLEDRTVPATITWVNSGSGNWDVGSNWSTGTVPGGNDTAVINSATAVTVTVQSGDSIEVESVTTGGTDALSITGGSFTVTTGPSVLSGSLSMTGGTLTAHGAGTSLTRTARPAFPGPV